MAAATIGSLGIDLGLNTARFESGLRKAQKETRTFRRRMERSFDSLNRRVSRFGKGLAASIGIGFSAVTVKRILDTADALEQFSNRLGISGEQLQAWQLVAARFNIQTNQLNLAIQRLTRRSAEAAVGMGEARGALAELGIDAVRFNELTLDQQMLLLARQFENVSNGADKLRLAFKLFDSEGTVFLQLLNEGEEGLRKLREMVEGQVWSDEQRKALADANTQIKILTDSITIGLGKALASAAESGTAFMNWVRELAKGSPGLNRFLMMRGFGGAVEPAKQLEITIDDAAGSMERVMTTAADLPAPLKTAAQWVAEYNEQFKKANENAEDQKQAVQQFANIFADDLVNSASFAFDEILKRWIRTLAAMVIRAQATRLFGGLLGATGLGAALGNITKLPSFGSGTDRVPGAQGEPMLAVVHGGERIIPPGQSGSGLQINAPVTVTGLVTEEDVARGFEMASAQAQWQLRQDRMRGRRG